VSVPATMERVMVAVCDVHGALRGKLVAREAFERARSRGLAMTDLILALDPTDAPIESYRTIGIRSGAADLRLWPDESTLAPLTWRPGTWICLAEARWADGSMCELASREVARRVLDDLEGRGMRSLAAFEYEVRVREQAGGWLTSGLSYSLEQLGMLGDLVDQLPGALEALGVELTALHTEAGPGLLELNLAPQQGLAAADHAALVRFAVRDLARTLGLEATFMAKVAAGEEGSSGHVHLSLWEGERNAFALTPAEEVLGPVLAGAVAGILEHLPAASAILNPTINAYKRLVPGFFAPVNATWGFDNRSTALRVIRSSDPGECRIECRRPGADANPYLVLAALLASALAGIDAAATPPAPIAGDAYAHEGDALPTSLWEAVAALEADGMLTKFLGPAFVEYYLTSRRWELAAFQAAVSSWELERYQGVI
jgi:glutamine synthetase